MNGLPRLRCIAWSGIAPGLTSADDWRAYARGSADIDPQAPLNPDLSRVPPMLRRRLTPLTRLVVASWVDACAAANLDGTDAPLVFASCHGEIGTLETLLDLQRRGEALSPTDFCHSVHHTPTGYLSLITGHRGIARTVSAGSGTFMAGLLETVALLHTSGASRVALTVADEVVPAAFGSPSGFPPFPFALTFIFGLKDTADTIDDPRCLPWDLSVFDYLKEL